MAKKKVGDNSFLDIDKESLDEEWLNQPRLYKEYSDLLAEANRDMDDAKNELEITRAELEQAIRLKPNKFALAKVTDNSVKACILAQDEYQTQQRVYLDAKHRADILKGAVAALDHRKRALENLVYLHGQGYYATPRASEEDAEEMSRAKKKKARKPMSREELEDD